MTDENRVADIADILDGLDEGSFDVFTDRFFILKHFIYRCLANGWDDSDLREIRTWIRDQGELDAVDQDAVTVIDGLLAENQPAGFPATVAATQHAITRNDILQGLDDLRNIP